MKKIVIATNNKNKVKEIKSILEKKNLNVELLTLSDLNITFDVEETGLTYAKNAEKKAVEYFELCKLPVIAEDSGLSIDALNGLPGIFSKRIYEGKSENEGNEIILENMKGIQNRSASYVATYCYYDGANKIFANGYINGEIDEVQTEGNGFAYDKIFISKDFNKPMSLLTNDEKNGYSHRFFGLSKLIDKLEAKELL